MSFFYGKTAYCLTRFFIDGIVILQVDFVVLHFQKMGKHTPCIEFGKTCEVLIAFSTQIAL